MSKVISPVISSPRMGTVNRTSFQDIVVRHRPGTKIEVRLAGKERVLCFLSGADELFLALDDGVEWKTVESVLVSMANMLACCHSCAHTGLRSILCRTEYRLISRRLREFLGAAGYQEFVARSPISAGNSQVERMSALGDCDAAQGGDKRWC